MADSINAIRTMQAKDVVASKLATAYITIDGNRYLLFQAKKFSAKYKKTKKEVPILGWPTKGHKATGGEGTGSMTIYANTPLFNDMIKKYQQTGVDTYFDVQVTNHDPTSAAGRQTIIYKDCNIDEVQLSAFDADGDWLEQDIDFTFEDCEYPEKFAILDGMS